jgi:arylsulfatase A-like enzyme
VACAFLVGCAPQKAGNDLVSLNGKFVIDEGLYVYPDRHWRHRDRGGLKFRKAGSLLVWVEGEAPQHLRAEFWPAGPTRRFHFKGTWDGQPLWDQPRAAGQGSLTVEIHASGLTPGLHRLTLERVKSRDFEKDRDRGESSFSRIELEKLSGDRPEKVSITGNGFIASFLDFGVTGQSSQRLDGCLFAGPQRYSQRISNSAESKISFILENRSHEPARFTVARKDVDPTEFPVPARARLPVELLIPPGDHELTLEVSGHREGSFLWGSPQLRPLEAGVSPSVFFITLDTTRLDAVSPFSIDNELTPNLAAFVRQSSVFSNAWATAPWTLPSHASMFTGRYPSHHGAGVTSEVLAREWDTLAELFRDQGYMTAGFVGGHMSSSVFGLAQGFSEYHDPKGFEMPGDRVTDLALDYLEKNSESPHFVFINYFDPHGPYAAPPRYQEAAGVAEAGAHVDQSPVWGPLVRGEKGSWSAIRKDRVPQDAAGLAYLRSLYMAEIAFMDSQLGRLFDRLRATRVYDQALIVVVADHGEFLGEHGLTSHSYRLDPELTHVPLVIKRPGQVDGEVIHDLASHVDLYASVARLMGIDAPVADGLHLFSGKPSTLKDRDHVLMEEHASRIHPLLGPFRVADHLFGLQWRDRREVLFDGRVECESHRDGTWLPVSCEASWEERMQLLGERMRAAARLSADHAIGDLDQEEAEKLRALGYLE